VILMMGDYTLESALEAIRKGAADFLPKPVDRIQLKKMLDDTAALHDQRRSVTSAQLFCGQFAKLGCREKHAVDSK